MPRGIDWNNVPETSEYFLLPQGEYLMKVVEATQTTTQKGDEMWNIVMTVEGGQYAGNEVRDRIVWSPAALPRAKKIMLALGAPLDADVDTNHILNRTAYVTVEHQKGQDKHGNARTYANPTFAGYRHVNSKPPAPAASAAKPGPSGSAPTAQAKPDEVPF